MRGRVAIMCANWANNEEGIAVFEIKELFHAQTACTDRKKKRAPGFLFMCTFLYISIHNLKYSCTCRVHIV